VVVLNNIQNALKARKLILDGGMGTELYKRGIVGDTELANLSAGDSVFEIHKSYVEAGADIITANTFGAYSHKHSNFAELIKVAISNAKKACETCKTGRDVWVALDMGPTGLVLEPYGEASTDECYAIFESAAQTGKEAGADLIIVETMMDLNELEIAVKAAKTTGLPIFSSMSFTEKGKTMYGASVKDMATTLERLGVDAIGMNCGFGPEPYATLVKELIGITNLPVLLQPNAGIPIAGVTGLQYDFSPELFAKLMLQMSDSGVRILGGCCGTEPAHIALVAQLVKGGTK